NEAMIERRWKTLLISVILLMLGLGIPMDLAAETREEKVDDVVLRVPTAWKKETPKSKMRALQFSIPPVSEDSGPAELAVFNFRGGGTVNQNIERWIGQFDPQGRQAALFEGTTQSGRYWLADISGTYNQSVGPPILRKTEKRPGSRVLAAIVVTKAGKVLYLKLAGPDKTVAGEAKRMREMFGADAASEKPYSLGS
ncbi:MAG: hypothetical protein VX431_02250, partial [Planctomycetota bacterium]|nr:hypothetical protein [Planctomycetota bacterium]